MGIARTMREPELYGMYEDITEAGRVFWRVQPWDKRTEKHVHIGYYRTEAAAIDALLNWKREQGIEVEDIAPPEWLKELLGEAVRSTELTADALPRESELRAKRGEAGLNRLELALRLALIDLKPLRKPQSLAKLCEWANIAEGTEARAAMKKLIRRGLAVEVSERLGYMPCERPKV